MRLQAVGGEGVTAKFDMTLALVESEGKLWGSLEYNTDLFDAERIERMCDHFQILLEGIVADPQQRLSQLPLLTQNEREFLLIECNLTQQDFPTVQALHHLFEHAAHTFPHAPALVCQHQTLTYQQLNERANQLAHALLQHGVGQDTPVALYLERSVDLVVGMLGILKAGAAYLPLDPALPQERLRFMLQDSRAPLLVSVAPLAEALGAVLPTLLLDRDAPTLQAQSALNPDPPVAPSHLVYVIYTSGSTGRPKGVLIEHAQLLNYVQGVQARLRLPVGSHFASVSTFAADLGHTAVFAALCSGGCLHLISSECAMDPGLWQEYFATHRIDCLKIVPSHLQALLSGGVTADMLPRGVLVLGGEASRWEFVERIRQAVPSLRVLNHYGPTETTVGVLTYEVGAAGSERPAGSGTVPLGRPLPNSRVYVLNGQGQPVPLGVAGEVFIGGSGVGRGYLNQPELTRERFVTDVFGGEVGARMYRTGDLARYLPEGTLEFLGRVDHQVKIRGHRIELGEIESVLLSHPQVREAVVVAREEPGGSLCLVGYVVEAGAGLEVEGLRGYLKERLLEVMVPSALVVLGRLPLTANGKIDRGALPAPESVVREVVGPRSAVESVLVELWGELLGRSEVSVLDNFFELGGHSLLATQVISRVRETFEVEVPLRALFDTPTIAGLAERIEMARGEDTAVPPLVRVPREGYLPLSFAQQRLWFLDQFEPGNSVYNVPSALRLTGPLNFNALQQSLQQIVHRHEALRTTFALIEGEPVQVIPAAVPVLLPLLDLQSLDPDSRKAEARRLIDEEAQRPFDLEQGPLFRASLLRLSEEDHILLLSLHHIVSDGWSQGVLRRELVALYRAGCHGQPSELPDLPLQYADYAVWQRQWLQGAALARQVDYWKAHLAGAPSFLELPTDRPRPAVKSFRGARRGLQLSQALTSSLSELSQREGATLFMTLLAAFQTLLYHYSGQSDIVVGTPIANRTRSEVEGLIGLFMNTLALRGDLSGDPRFTALLGRVRESALGAYAHQDLPFEKLVEELKPERSLSHSPVFQVMLILQNAPGRRWSLKECGCRRSEARGSPPSST